MTDETVVLFPKRPKVSPGSPFVAGDNYQLERLREDLRLAKVVRSTQRRALAHQDGDAVRRAYARGTYWAERVSMAQWWSDHLDQLRDGGKVIPLRSTGKGKRRS